MFIDKNHWVDWFAIVLITTALVILGLQQLALSAQATPSEPQIAQADFAAKLKQLKLSADDLIHTQASLGMTIISPGEIHARISTIEQSFANSDYPTAQVELDILLQKVAQAKSQIVSLQKQRAAADAVSTAAQPQMIPILMYHKTPPDFAGQLESLKSKGYTTITMTELADYFDGFKALPHKPVVITFDDGFANQMQAFSDLQHYKMKATFYLIVGGEASGWCIGILRHNMSCGDDYLSWQQVHTLAGSGLIEIGAHTIDHADLPSLLAQEQVFQIESSKKVLEDELHISVTTLAYPYGRFDNSVVTKTMQAGFRSAVTTLGGLEQSSHNRFTLLRVRNALLLP